MACAAVAAQPDTGRTTWDVREVDHPVMGAIMVAVPQSGFTTNVGGMKIVSAAFVSCEKATRRIAIELANSVESDTRGGLPPVEMPRLVCNVRVNGTPVRTDLAARWNVNALGDALARGLAPAELRRCSAIEVQQHVTLPPGTPLASHRIAMTLVPGDGGLATVFAACDGAAATKPMPSVVPPAALPASAQPVTGPWKAARTLSSGKTNVRATPRIDGALVTQLYPGTPVLAQKAEGDWWLVKPHKGVGFSGFIRADRLAFE
jgi:hypothetical protein